MSPPASLPGGRPLCGRLPGQTPVPPHHSSPSPVIFLPPLPTSAGPVCPLLPVPPVLGCVSPFWDPAGPIPASGRSRSHPPTPAQPCRGGWGGEDLGEAEARRAPLLLLLLPAPPLRAPRTRLALAASIVPGLPGRVLQPSGVRQRRGLPDSHRRGTCPRPAWGKVSTGKGDACCSRPTSTAPGTFGVEEMSRPRGDAFPASSRGVDVAPSGRRRVLAVAFVTSLAAGCSRC